MTTETVKHLVTERSRRGHLLRLFLVGTGGVGVTLMALGAMVYAVPQPFLVPGIGRFVPLPAAVVDGHLITFRELALRQDLAIRLSDGLKQGVPDRKTLFDKAVEETVIERLAQASGFAVTPELVRSETSRIENTLFGKDATAKNRLTRQEREKFLVRPFLYREKTYAQFAKETASSREAARRVLSESAERFGTGTLDAASGVSLYESEWLDVRYLDSAVAETLAALDIGRWSGLVETEDGYHFLKLLEQRSEDDAVFYRVDRLSAPKPGFADWLAEQKRAMGFQVFVSALR